MKPNYYLLITFLLAFFLRLYHVDTMALRADEASVVILSAEEPRAILQNFTASDPRPPLYHLLLHYWMPFAGASELAARFPTIVAGVLIVALVYLLAQTLSAQKSLANITAFLAAINPALVWDAQDVHMSAFLVLFSTASFLCFLRRRWLIYAIFSALALFSHYLAAFILLAQGALVAIDFFQRRLAPRDILRWLASQLLILVLILPWLAWVSPFLASFHTEFFPPATLPEILTRAFVSFAVGRTDARLMPIMVEPLVGNLFAFGFLALFVVGLTRRESATHFPKCAALSLLIYLLVPLIAFFIFSSVRFPIFDERYVLYLIPAFVVIVARGVATVRSRPVAIAALAFITLASANSLHNYYDLPAFAKSPDWHSFVRALKADAQRGDVLIQNYPDPALPYYLNNALPRVLLPRTNADGARTIAEDLSRLSARFDRLWLQPAPYAEWDTEGLVAQWLARHAREIRTEHYRGVDLQLFLPARIAMTRARSVAATVGDRVRLIAYEFDDAPARANESRRLVLYWETTATLERDYTVFVHLYAEDGRLVGQTDNAPVTGTFPTRAWDANEIVVDAYDVRVPPEMPAGAYRLMAGMYDTASLERLRAVDVRGQRYAEDRIPLTNLILTR